MSQRQATSITALVLVLLIWSASLLTALNLVQTYGTRTFPQNDEIWVLYDAGPGINLNWLWKPWAEHRIPLAKLIWKGVLQTTGYDFRIGNFLTVVALAGTALAMIWAARRRRGRTIFADAFFPLALLNFGQAQVFLWWWQVNHALAPIAAAILLLLVVLHGNNLSVRQAIIIAASLIVLALCGPGGLPYVLALAVWLGYWAAMRRRSQTALERRTCIAVLLFAAIAVGLVCLYFVNYTPYFPANDSPDVSEWPPSPGLAASLIAGVEILGLGFGTATKSYAIPWGLLVLAIGLASAAVQFSKLSARSEERSRALGFLAFLGAAAVLVATIARSRAAMGLDYIYQGHYLTLLGPLLCCLYFIWDIRGGRLARWVQYGMVLILCTLLPLNLKHAVDVGNDLQAKAIAFERDVRSNVPAFILAERHFASDVVPRADKLSQIIREHKKNGIGIFQQVRDDFSFRINNLEIESAALEKAAVHAGVLQIAFDNLRKNPPTFSLSEPQHVFAIRLRYAYVKTQNAWPSMRVYWRNSMLEDFEENTGVGQRELVSIVAGPDQPTWALVDGKVRTDAKVRRERTLTVWVDAIIDQFRIYPDSAPCEFQLSRIELIQ